MWNKITSEMFSKLMNALQFYRNISIKKKLLLVLYIQILIPLVFIGFFSFKSSEEIITNKSLSYSKDILSLIELRLQDTVRNLNIISQDLSSDESIYEALMNDDSNNINMLYSYEVGSKLNNVFLNAVMTRTEIQSMCIVTNKKRFFIYDNNNNSDGSNIKSIVLQKYTEITKSAAQANGKAVWFFNTKNGVVQNSYLVRMIYNRDNYKEIGLLVVEINMEFFDFVLQGLESEVMQNTTILSSDNEIIIYKNKAALDKFKKVIQDIPNEKNSFVDKKNNIFVAHTYLSEPRWRIVTYIPLNQLYSDVETLRDRIILLCMGSILILSVVSVFMSFDMIKPINQLVKAMKGMNIDNISDSYIEIERRDELGFLHKTFNNMAKEIDHLVTWIYREQITRKEAELKALQSQINPHFLFNTLESINWMAQLNNVPEISSTVSDLSTLLEASIGRDDRLITIEEEFMYIDKYIALLKRRFEDRITLNKEVDPKVLYIKIPRLLIQPLIENAVYHGVENSRGKGIITLTASIREDLLIIEVIDNGNGISTDELVKLNKGLEMDNDTYFKSLSNKKNKSIGIDNVNRRIKLFYGEKYGINLESKLNIYTKVSVTLPAQSYKKEGFYVQSTNN
ncbi:sensor histidine kinase [Ruminiclostridium cellobioparum]|uniref:Integral membrane sensor signal transduction histidine kinase n=1 Tax=Ruminiclostridium cellobioparum subsp. termitidis CT1112 TaxID=1195236 RepID=S0FG42_RUMCE|nr:sensor histidine kinase [Ruminiclostridium cellobioparum]EMS69817.1 integral membrane sensor signal transduction histidine kinase [Ruminiclostridium cellobioparum subsp. termitidis CT1112]